GAVDRVLLREGQALRAAERDDLLEPVLAGQLQREVALLARVGDEQDDAIARRQALAVVGDLGLRGALRLELELVGQRVRGDGGRGAVALGVHRADLGGRLGDGGRRRERRRQQQGERAALARGGADPDLPAEQPGDLARDREPEAGAAVAPVRRPVGLLEGLEDQAQLVL